jgi:hypothetical protein
VNPQEAVERALAVSRSDDCVVIAEETSGANLRWAGNTLTTNGVSRSRQLTVIAVDRRADGAAAGIISRAGVRPDHLAADVIKALLGRNPGLDVAAIDDVYWGAANQAGEDNRNVARMAVLLAGLPVEIPGATVNRLCGSGMEAVSDAARAIAAGDIDIAVAGGTEILQACDIRVAGESARFGISEARWGLFPLGGSAVRLPRQIPYTVAADLLLTGRHITAAEALAIGLIGHVVPDGQALAKALEIAEMIAANGPVAVRAILRVIRETEGMAENEAFALEARAGMAVFASQDAREGPRAFAEKRRPEFRDR